MEQYTIHHNTAFAEAWKKHHGENVAIPATTNVVQIGSKQAWVLHLVDGTLVLQSYNTLVSVKWANTHEFERLGKWSVTTSRHQSEFERRF